jgi:hypothetical protein
MQFDVPFLQPLEAGELEMSPHVNNPGAFVRLLPLDLQSLYINFNIILCIIRNTQEEQVNRQSDIRA